jgi:type I restriction enzyme S subunit
MIDDLKPYPEYKDSSLPWLGRIPKHWDCLPHRAIFEEVKEQGHVDEQLLSVTIGKGIIRQEDLLADSSKKDSSNLDKSKYKLVEPGDIAYNKMRAWQGAVGLSRYRGIVSPAYIVQRVRGQLRPEYFHYLFRTPGFAKEAERWSYGITSDQWSLRPQHFKMIYSCVPPLDEQELIVGFLRDFDRQVRRFIRNRRRLIEVVNEQKQAIINRAVTRGLDPNASLKPSGVDGLGDIPEHWEVVKLKFLARIKYGLGQPPKEATNGLPLIRATNVKSGRIVERNLVYVDPSDVPDSRNAILRKNEIIVVRSGALTADSAIIPESYEGAVAGYDMVVTVRSALPEFVANALLSAYMLRDQLHILRSRAAQPHLNAEELGNVLVVLPPPDEQDGIVEHLAQETDLFQGLIGRAEREIDLIREYRTRLITDVVTGKIDVRHLAPPPGSEDLEETADELEPLDDASGEQEKESFAEEVAHADD